MAVEWKVAFPLHPEYRTLPMVWYIPPLSPIQSAVETGAIGHNGLIPEIKDMRIPIEYLANLLTAGKTEPIVNALQTMIDMRKYMRSKTIYSSEQALQELSGHRLDAAQIEEMYQVMAIANYEDRFVIPSAHKEQVSNTFEEKASCGFSFGEGCHNGHSKESLFGTRKASPIIFHGLRKKNEHQSAS